jgi:hypothetical protein
MSILDRSASANESDASPAGGFFDELHSYRREQSAQLLTVADNATPATKSGAGAGASQFMNYVGYITYASLAAGAFGHDDPLQIELRATRFFQEKFLHHHAVDNPQVWTAMGDLMMSQEHLAGEGAKVKPPKLKAAKEILKDVGAGLRGPADYVLAAKALYMEGINKADARAAQEAKDHKDEKRLDGRLRMLSGETDRVSAIESRDNSIAPIEDELGTRVSMRLDTAAFLERYGSQVPELGWNELAAKLRREAQATYNDPHALSEPVRRRLHQRYPNELVEQPQA